MFCCCDKNFKGSKKPNDFSSPQKPNDFSSPQKHKNVFTKSRFCFYKITFLFLRNLMEPTISQDMWRYYYVLKFRAEVIDIAEMSLFQRFEEMRSSLTQNSEQMYWDFWDQHKNDRKLKHYEYIVLLKAGCLGLQTLKEYDSCYKILLREMKQTAVNRSETVSPFKEYENYIKTLNHYEYG